VKGGVGAKHIRKSVDPGGVNIRLGNPKRREGLGAKKGGTLAKRTFPSGSGVRSSQHEAVGEKSCVSLSGWGAFIEGKGGGGKFDWKTTYYYFRFSLNAALDQALK